MSEEARAWRLVAVVATALVILLCSIEGFRLLSADRGGKNTPDPDYIVDFKVVDYSSLEGWDIDDHREAIKPMQLSCKRMAARKASDPANSKESLGLEGISFSGKVADWREACAFILDTDLMNFSARTYFEEYFVPVQIIEREKGNASSVRYDGLFTGYFEPVYVASDIKSERFSVPVLSRPNDLVMVDLGSFREELAGQRIAGTVRGGNLVPFLTHEEIIESELETEILAWMDPNDLLFLQIQGSGKLRIGEKVIRVGYAGQNGHPYTAIGRPLIQSGAIAIEDMSMQAIYEWLEKAPVAAARDLRYVNQSYVFFKPLDNLPEPELGPIGAGNVQLSSGRSLAVDRRFYAMGMPIWVSYQGLDDALVERRLFIAQDTGGAIRGPIRGDVYVGGGKEAGAVAGQMKQKGQLTILVPKSVAKRLEVESAKTAAY